MKQSASPYHGLRDRRNTCTATPFGGASPYLAKERTPWASSTSPCGGLYRRIGPCSAKQLVDGAGAEPDLLVVRAAQVDVVEHVKVPCRIAVLIEPDQRAGDVEVDLH